MNPRTRLSDLAESAHSLDQVFLPRLVPGWWGATVAVAGAALGEFWAIRSRAGAADGATHGPYAALGWLALMLVFAGLLIQLTQRRVRGGWQVDIAARRLDPVDLPGQAVMLDDSPGWALACVAGQGFRSIAIDLRHAERGRVARVFQSPPRVRLKDIRACSALTDILAERLRITREGLKA